MAKKTDSAKKPAAQAAPAKTTAKISAPAPASVKVPVAASKAAPVEKEVKKPAVKTERTAPVPPLSKAAAPTPTAATAKSITTEEIALQAYFISEKRHTAGLPGNAHQDWLEAERQLKAKAQKAKASAKKSA